MTDNRYARQILFFGEAGQARIAASQVGIVGLGGLGAHVAQGLAYLGVGSMVLVDDDVVDLTNLNRLVGATRRDATERALKVSVAQRMIGQINPAAQVKAIPKNLRTREALETLSSCPVVFGCVDHDGPRLILTEMAAAYNATLVDCATEINPDNEPDGGFGGRVVVCPAGEFCLDCAGEINGEAAKQELEAPATQEQRRLHGYGLGERGPAPAVVLERCCGQLGHHRVHGDGCTRSGTEAVCALPRHGRVCEGTRR